MHGVMKIHVGTWEIYNKTCFMRDLESGSVSYWKYVVTCIFVELPCKL